MTTQLTIDNDPYPGFDAQLDEGSVVWSDNFQAWIVCGLDDLKKVATDLQTYSVARGYRESKGEAWNKVKGKGVDNITSRWLRYNDPPDWYKLREAHEAAVPYKFVQPEEQSQELRDQFRTVVSDHMQKSQGKTRVEAMQEWCIPLPVLGTMTVLGLDLNDYGQLYEWVVNGTLIGFRFPFDRDFWSDEAAARGSDYADKLVEYMRGVLAQKRSQPGEDFFSRLIKHADKAAGEFTDDDLIKIVINHMNGGFHDSAFQVLGDGIFQLLRTGQYQLLVDDPSRASTVVEEIIRYHAPAPLGARRASKDVTLGGKNIKKDDFVFINVGAAQRDPKLYDNAREFDISRPGVANGELSFGYGPHKCSGRAQVRLLSATFFEELAKMFPKLQIEEWPANCYMKLRYQPRQDIALLESLPLTLG